MAIPFTNGVYVNTTVPAVNNRQQLCNAINAALVTAGWTSTFFNKAGQFEFTGQPNNNDTVTLDGVVYTAKTVISNVVANQFLIDVNPLATYYNLVNAINGGLGSGTKYSAATNPHPTMTANMFPQTMGGAQMFIAQTKTTGFGAPVLVVSSAAANATWDNGNCVCCGYRLDTSLTANTQGLQCSLLVLDCGETAGNPIIRLSLTQPNLITRSAKLPGFADANAGIPGQRLLCANNTYRIVATNQWMFVYQDGIVSPNLALVWWGCGVPYVEPSNLGARVSAVTNSGGLIKVTTATPHGASTGDAVCIRLVNGVTGVNDSWTVTVIDTLNFTLNGSSFNGVYTGGGIIGVTGATYGSVGEAMWASGSESGGSGGINVWIRHYLSTRSPVGDYHYLFNGGGWCQAQNGNGSGTPTLVLPIDAAACDTLTSAANEELQLTNKYGVMSEAVLKMGISPTSQGTQIGQLWDALAVFRALTQDVVDGPMVQPGTTWINLTANNVGANNILRGSLLFRVS